MIIFIPEEYAVLLKTFTMRTTAAYSKKQSSPLHLSVGYYKLKNYRKNFHAVFTDKQSDP